MDKTQTMYFTKTMQYINIIKEITQSYEKCATMHKNKSRHS